MRYENKLGGPFIFFLTAKRIFPGHSAGKMLRKSFPELRKWNWEFRGCKIARAFIENAK